MIIEKEHITKKALKLKTTMLKSSVCDHSIAYILVKETITVVRARYTSEAKPADRNN